MSSPTGIHSGAQGTQLLAPVPMASGSGHALTLTTTTTTTMTSSSNDPSLRRQPTPLPRAPVETKRILKTADTNNPTWKMLNQYRIIRLLGRGTHGTVKYGEDMSKADPRAPDFAVAIKIIKRQPNRKRLPRADGRERTNTALARIRYEVAVMKRCNHDHIVRLIEVIDDPRNQSVFLVMEYLEGGEIKWRGPEKTLLSLGQTRRIVRDVLLGLEYLHYMGIIHRDIKPANMLWTKGRARVKLTDFGVAHFSKPLTADKGISSDGSPYVDDEDHLYKTEGTPAFYAPEQAYNQNGLPVPKFERGKRPAGVKSDQIFPMTKALDVWAFGVSIYCFLFGRPPYWALNVHALCHAIIEDEYVIPPLATSDQLPVDSDDPDLNEALKLMKGMMTKPVHARLTLSQAKVSTWLTGDLDDPVAWLKETDPEAKEAIFIGGEETGQAVVAKNHSTRVSSIMRALGIRKENLRHPKADIRSMRGPSLTSLEYSTHRALPPKPRSLCRPSADQPSSPIDALSAASSPTGTSHFGESYFGRPVSTTSNGRVGGLSRMVSSIFRRAKKSTSAEAILSAPGPITPITPRMPHDISASSSPPAGIAVTPRTVDPVEELDPLMITYSSEEDEDEEEGDVPLLGYGGFESYQAASNGVSPSEASRSFGLIRQFDPERSEIARRFSTTNSEPVDTPKRVYDSSYPQHTHKVREDSWIATGTITSTPSSPRQETIYIPSATPHPPRPGHPIVRSRAQSNFELDDESEEEDEVLEISRKTRTTHLDS